jgi:hypothetical protein
MFTVSKRSFQVFMGFLGMASACVMPAVASADPLFARMAGFWVGKGERVQFTSAGVPSRSTPVLTEVQSRIEGDRLVSENQFWEGDPQSPEYRNYQRVYWMRFVAEADVTGLRSYVLGGGRGEAVDGEVPRGGSLGEFSGARLVVVQEIPGSPVIRVVGQTEFLDSKTTLYREEISMGDRILSRSRIRYERQQDL